MSVSSLKRPASGRESGAHSAVFREVETDSEMGAREGAEKGEKRTGRYEMGGACSETRS